MKPAKYATVLHCRTGKKYEQKEGPKSHMAE